MIDHITRYLHIGTGSRAQLYLDALSGEHRADGQVVGLIDLNPGRIAYHRDRLAARGVDVSDIVTGAGDDLERLVDELRVDRVIVTSPDYTHAGYVARALRAGADVVVEKPLTIDPAGTRLIAEAVNDSGRSVVVTHNYRYSPRNTALRQLIADGHVGRVLSVGFEWVLDTAHGTDYFRRWHRDKAHSGGLLVHKASHHFDLINWCLADTPVQVYARGGVRFYGAEAAAERGLPEQPLRGTHDGPHTPWELDLRLDPQLKALYLDNEHFDGYLRDRDVFAPGVTTEDNLALVVDYAGGAVLSYTLNAHSPWEGYRIVVNGTEGRAELEVVERSAVLVDAEARVLVDPSAQPEQTGRRDGQRLTVQRHWEGAHEIEIPEGAGGHGGGDALLLHDVFVGPGEDPLSRPADFVDGVRAIAVGMAGNESLRTGAPVRVDDLLLGVELGR